MIGDAFELLNRLPLPVRYSLDQLASRFEADLQAGELPSLESYLEEAAPEHRPALLTELLSLEIDHRRRQGESPSLATYADRFPDLYPIVQRLVDPAAAHLPEPFPTLPGYEIVGELGRGGMGIVYRARQLALNRPVALKMLHPRGSGTVEERIRFRLEAESIALLQHPNIVQVHASGEHLGQPYLVLELVEGGSLRQFIGRPHAPAEAATFIEILARAVHFAHGCGIIHRDLKPGNVLLVPTARTADEAAASLSSFVPRISDFGLAKRLGSSASWHTRTDLLLGTPAYMAPEQTQTGLSPVGPAIDIYALGVLLYQLLTGELPHQADDPLETLLLVRHTEPQAPSEHLVGLPPDLDTICLKCLRKDPAARYRTAQDLADDLHRYLVGEPIQARPVRLPERIWKWSRRNPLIAGLLAAVVLLLVTVATVSTAAAYRLHRQRAALLEEQARTRIAEDDRRLALVGSLLTSVPESVPFILESLAQSPETALPLLHDRFQQAGPKSTHQLRAAVALAFLGEPPGDFLLDAVPEAPAAESQNLALAFRTVPQAARLLTQRAGAASLLRHRARHAILALDLGDLEASQAMLAETPDPTARATFIELFRTWHGLLDRLPALLRESNSSCRSGLCAALGQVDPALIADDTRHALVEVLLEQFRQAPDPSTHSAASWALRQWGVPLPALESLRSGERPAADQRWFIGPVGLTMLRVEPGQVTFAPGVTLRITRPYFLADREVTVAQFRAFVNDPDCAPNKPPRTWKGLLEPNAYEAQCPVNYVSREQMFLFCNWLSRREGRRLCYSRTPEVPGGWTCDFAADGYRLPTEAEWDHAHRAESQTSFFFGNDDGWFHAYAHVAATRTLPGGSKLPNRWGFFDMVGNLWEMCWDSHDALPPGVHLDYVAKPRGEPWIARGGAFDSGSYDCRATHRFFMAEAGRSLGFRVACGGLGR
ncbi:MAG: bifunctional serine/threonine-protein kinase/formylglycine-generating enzyme family protein [Gemmataceae bacterium]